jgi:peptidoglycan/LPS O-acetylase OafA/YrhL
VLGLLRFFLASCVVSFHLTERIPSIGILAVNFFYVISGYLITMILNETYRFSASNFFANRFLRIYPAHYAVSLLSLLFFWGLPGAHSFHAVWGVPQWQDWVGNLLIFPWTVISPRFRIDPTTWSIAIELCCYFWLWLIVSRRPWIAVATIAIAILWQIRQFHFGVAAPMHYGPVSAAILPFSMGAASYFMACKMSINRLKRSASVSMQLAILLAVIVVFMLNWHLAAMYDPSPFFGTFYYLNTVLACVAVVAFHGLRVDGAMGRVSSWCGDLSYPVFLSQWIAGFIAWHLMGTSAPMRGWAIFGLGYVISVAIGIAVMTQRNLHRLRG